MHPNGGHIDELGARVGRGTWRRFLTAGAVGGVVCAPASALSLSSGFVSAPSPGILAIVSGAVALAVGAGLWALVQQRQTLKLTRHLRAAGARSRAQVGERDALLAACREGLVVWGRDGGTPLSYGGAEPLLDSCLKGAEATELSAALDALSDKGMAFELNVHDEGQQRIVVRGRAVGGMAAVWIAPETVPTIKTTDYRAILDALPLPVWLRDRTMRLIWGNQAFLSAAGAADVEAATRGQMSLETGERDLASQASEQSKPVLSRRFAVIAGQRRALALTEIPLDLGVVGAANDVTEVAASEARLQQHIDAHTDTLDKLATAVAIFNDDRRLSFYNRSFARLWDLPETWLDTLPNDGEILDRLREERKLPEQRDYQSWRRERLDLYVTARARPSEELWHTPDGKNLRVVAQPHPLGGLTILFEDVTERISLESSFNTLTKVQSATLNSLREGVAVFGPDGRLKLHNAAFMDIWGLVEADLTGEPHIRAIADVCATKFAAETLWEQLVQAVVSDEGGANDFGEVERSDRSILALGLAALPDGATLVTFSDVTARFRIEGILRERAEALEAADRLKSDFIKHVSYELRTPLNTIMGFAEHLASEVPGALNDRQREYMQAIVSSSNTLKDLVNDILDLALVESGALRLELTRIELGKLLADIAAHAREWAAKAGLSLDLAGPDMPCEFFADERRVSQIVYNLLSNAIKYTPKGGHIVLGGKIEGEDVQLFVKDDGPGIDPELRANVFERFASKGTREERGGAGLGLALVNRFVELHNGWVEIEENGGTLVRCHLPRRLHDGGPADGETSAAE